MGVLKMRQLLKLVNEVQETMEKNPDSDVDFMMRGRYGADAQGEVSVMAGVDVPAIPSGVGGSATGGFTNHWQSVGEGQWVLRIARPGTVTAAAMMGDRQRLRDDVGALTEKISALEKLMSVPPSTP